MLYATKNKLPKVYFENILHKGSISVSDIIIIKNVKSIQNRKAKSEEYLYVFCDCLKPSLTLDIVSTPVVELNSRLLSDPAPGEDKKVSSSYTIAIVADSYF